MHPDLLVKALAAIEPRTTLEKFCAASGIVSKSVAKNLLGFLACNNVGTITANGIEFSSSDRLYAAMLALQKGCDVEQVSRHLSWKDFEKLASEILISFGYGLAQRLPLPSTASTGSGAIFPRCWAFQENRPREPSGFSRVIGR
ncbi:MAG: hypothetical protein AUJ08_06105 [Thaumarchaeota archaeon 13_1_40CM_3_50_5]|nr:MAG: hypothetical protein AUJ08_06105 [Thaumarchaeota archaeon 13_1_40CM_3_50_5]